VLERIATPAPEEVLPMTFHAEAKDAELPVIALHNMKAARQDKLYTGRQLVKLHRYVSATEEAAVAEMVEVYNLAYNLTELVNYNHLTVEGITTTGWTNIHDYICALRAHNGDAIYEVLNS
jgi:hypothetical protein